MSARGPAKDIANPATTERARATRARVLAAARDCVRELGPLGATSNEIARRGGVSWGVIQYHFGSREGILLAMIEDGFSALLDTLDAYRDAEPATPDDAISLLVDAVWSYCSQPDYLLNWDILRLLNHDPESAERVASMLRESETQLHRRIAHLLRSTTATDAALRSLRGVVFATMRGLALKQSFAGASTSTAAERKLLVRALRLAVAES